MFDNTVGSEHSEYIEGLCRIRSTGAGRDASGEPSPSRTTLVAREKVKDCYPILKRPVTLTRRPAGLEEEG